MRRMSSSFGGTGNCECCPSPRRERARVRVISGFANDPGSGPVSSTLVSPREKGGARLARAGRQGCFAAALRAGRAGSASRGRSRGDHSTGRGSRAVPGASAEVGWEVTRSNLRTPEMASSRIEGTPDGCPAEPAAQCAPGVNVTSVVRPAPVPPDAKPTGGGALMVAPLDPEG